MNDSIPVDWVDAFLDQKNGALFQFAGTRAITANSLALAAAKQFEKEGREPDSIRNKTGWFRGEDNNWRFEISDHDSSCDQSVLRKHESSAIFYQGNLGGFLKHPKLFAAYPYLAKMPIAVAFHPSFKHGSGQFTFSGEKLGRDENNAAITVRAESMEKLHEVLLHEVQHAIQEAESFNMGTSAQTLKYQYYRALESREVDLKSRLTQLHAIGEPTSVDNREIDIISAELTHLTLAMENTKDGVWDSAFYNKYLDTAGEREARVTAEDWKLTPEERAKRAVNKPLVQSNQPVVILNGSISKNVAADLQLSPQANIILLPQRSLMRLTQAADKSTFYHESAHLFLDFEIKTGRGKRPSSFQCDILDFVGAKNLDAIGRVEHEKFARGFEQYMEEVEQEKMLKAGHNSPINKVFSTVKGWVGGVARKCIDDKQPLSPTAKKMFSELVNSATPVDPAHLKQAEVHERLLAMKLVKAGIYERGDAYRCSKIICEYALAKAARDPDYPSVNRVFDHLNLDVEMAEVEDLKKDITFDYETFNLDELMNTAYGLHQGNDVDMNNYEHNNLSNAITRDQDRGQSRSTLSHSF